jgi:hypothetical protein
MKPTNMPARKLRRQLRAKQPKNAKTEPTAEQLSAARAVQTKKFGGKQLRMARWRAGQ